MPIERRGGILAAVLTAAACLLPAAVLVRTVPADAAMKAAPG